METVNAIGLQEIKKFLADRHLNGGTMTGAMLSAWAEDAEQKMADGNPPIIEIPSNWSVSGRPEQYEISAAGIDAGDGETGDKNG